MSKETKIAEYLRLRLATPRGSFVPSIKKSYIFTWEPEKDQGKGVAK
jgi:hypothetical protein